MNTNLEEFARQLSELIGQKITTDHIHPAKSGRYYYVQAPKEGYPLVLHHYRGPFCLDIHPNDFKRIETGEVSATEYISNANWLVGYYWGGGSMISGGYYQPMDIIGSQQEVKRYLKILACRGFNRASGYMPTEANCLACNVSNCPFSQYKKGDWENEMKEYDPRIQFLNALRRRFETQFPGYIISKLLYSEGLDDDTVLLYPLARLSDGQLASFEACISENVTRNLLIRNVSPENWEDYVESFDMKVRLKNDNIEYATKENIQAVFADVDYVAKKKNVERKQDKDNEQISFILKISRFFKNLF